MQFGELVHRVLSALREHGAMTSMDVARELDHAPKCVSACLSRLSRDSIQITRRIYVSGWVFDNEEAGDPRYPRATYSLGDKPNAIKPTPNKAAIAKRYYERNRRQCNSIFNMGAAGRHRRALAPSQ